MATLQNPPETLEAFLKRLQALAALQEALQGLPPPHPLDMKVFAEKNEAAAWGRKHATSHEFLRQVAVVVTRKEELEGHLHQVGAGPPHPPL